MEMSPEQHQHLPPVWARATAPFVMAAALLAGPYSNKPNQEPTSAPLATVSVASAVCPTPSDTAVSQVAQLIDNPDRSFMKDVDTDSITTIVGQTIAAREAVAKKLDLTVPQLPEQYFELGMLYEKQRSAVSFDTYYSLAKDYMSKFGVEVQIGRKDTDTSFIASSRTPTLGELESNNAKDAMLSVIQEYSRLPTEMVSYSGLKRIAFVAGTEGAGGYITLDPQNPTIVIDIGTGKNGPHMHEFGHILDFKMCNYAAYDDPMFLSITEKLPNYYFPTASNKKELYLTTHSKLRDIFLNALTLSAMDDDIDKYCKSVTALENFDSQVVSYSSYRPNVVEAKAGIFVAVSGPDFKLVSAKRTPILRKQSLVMLGRLYEAAPKLTEYLVMVGSMREDINSLEVGCSK